MRTRAPRKFYDIKSAEVIAQDPYGNHFDYEAMEFVINSEGTVNCSSLKIVKAVLEDGEIVFLEGNDYGANDPTTNKALYEGDFSITGLLILGKLGIYPEE